MPECIYNTYLKRHYFFMINSGFLSQGNIIAAYLIVMPCILFFTSKRKEKTHNFFLLVSILFLPILCLKIKEECWIFNFYSLIIYLSTSIYYTGLWEFIFRIFEKKISWDVKESFSHGIFGSFCIFSFLILTLFFIFSCVIFQSCLNIIFYVQQYIYSNIIPLWC